ncbi:MAG TPA: hypothetical protein VFP84_13195 [Kofleriaceae bacterium]|nr:hypothetical protein [Kofleriaceae bacterium]
MVQLVGILTPRIVRYLRTVPGSGYIHVDRLGRMYGTPMVIANVLIALERQGAIELTKPNGKYVRATGRWST